MIPVYEGGVFGDVTATFVIAGFDDDPDEITRLLATSPDEIGRVGELHQVVGMKLKFPVKDNYWELKSSKRRVGPLEGYIEELLVRIEPAADAIRKLPLTVTKKIVIQYSIVPNGSVPGLLLDANLLQRLAALGIQLEVDIN